MEYDYTGTDGKIHACVFDTSGRLPGFPAAVAQLSRNSIADDINADGYIVGYSDSGAFLYTPKGGLVNLNTLIPANSGWSLSAASGIGLTGLIAGKGMLNGEMHAFVLTPQR